MLEYYLPMTYVTYVEFLQDLKGPSSDSDIIPKASYRARTSLTIMNTFAVKE